MQVTKRDGRREPVRFDKITQRLTHLRDLEPSLPDVDVTRVAASVCSAVHDGISTSRLDELAADVAAGLCTEHPGYGTLAARILVSNLQKNTADSVLDTYERMADLLDPGFLAVVRAHADKLQAMVRYERDYDYDFFGFKTMEKLYLTRVGGVVVERPQHMWLRVAVALWGDGLNTVPEFTRVQETYEFLSTRRFTHASPTLFNAGLKHQQLASCFASGTRVCTTNRGVLNIEDVSIGDTVVTHAGTVRTVTQLHTNPLGSRMLYDIKAYKTPSVTVTGNHRFWAQRMCGKGVPDGSPGWHSVDELREGDFIAVPRRRAESREQVIDAYGAIIDGYRELGILNKYCIVRTSDRLEVDRVIDRPDWMNDRTKMITCRKACGEVNASWRVDEDFAWWMGVWYGDGCVSHRGPDKVPDHVSIVAHPSNVDLIERIRTIGHAIFGVKPVVSNHPTQALTTVRFHAAPLAVAFRHLFGHGHLGKRVFAGLFDWDRGMMEAFLGGLVSSDGCVSKSGCVNVTTTNHGLMEGVYHACRQVGIEVSLYKNKKRADWQYCPTWTICIPRASSIMRHVFKHYADDRLARLGEARPSSKTINVDGQVFVRLDSKQRSAREDTVVYTLGVEQDHSYNVEGLVCENCFLAGVEEDSIDGIFDALTKCARISKYGGGIGLHVSGVRGKGAPIKGTNGESDGLVPMLRVANAVASYVNQVSKNRTRTAHYHRYAALACTVRTDVLVSSAPPATWLAACGSWSRRSLPGWCRSRCLQSTAAPLHPGRAAASSAASAPVSACGRRVGTARPSAFWPRRSPTPCFPWYSETHLFIRAGRPAQGQHRGVHRAPPPRHLRRPGPQAQQRRRAPARTGPLLRGLGVGPVHAARGIRGHLVPVRPGQVPGAGGFVG